MERVGNAAEQPASELTRPRDRQTRFTGGREESAADRAIGAEVVVDPLQLRYIGTPPGVPDAELVGDRVEPINSGGGQGLLVVGMSIRILSSTAIGIHHLLKAHAHPC